MPALRRAGGIEVTPANEAYVLLFQAVTVGADTSPLFRIIDGRWVIQPCSGLPAGSNRGFGKLAADPTDANVLFASQAARVFRLSRVDGRWAWQDISDGLPGQWIYDLVARRLAAGAETKVLLRAAVPTRGIWERDVTAGAKPPAISLYLRNHLADLGWLAVSPDGVVDPYDPSQTLYHYLCADVKLDARQHRPTASPPDFYQTDPETPSLPSLDHTLFDSLADNSSNLPQADQAWVHVQVHNRAALAAANVSVWAVHCNAAAGVPSLAKSAKAGDKFPFWSQFGADGAIKPNLPADSPWTSIGPPRLLPGIDAAHPQIASWNITIPTLPTGDPGHYCLAVFVHSATSPINETGYLMDAITRTNRQVGQKNLHIGAPLPATAPPSPSGSASGPTGATGTPRPMVEYVEFHNPTDDERIANLVFQLDRLPPQLSVSFQLTPVRTVAPLRDALVGVASQRPTRPRAFILRSPRRSRLERLLASLRTALCRLGNLLRRMFGRPARRCARQQMELPTFAPTTYEAATGQRVEVRGVRLAPHERVAAALAITPNGTLVPGARYTFDIQQVIESEQSAELVGGGRYVVRVEGEQQQVGGRSDAPFHELDSDRTGDEGAELERQRQHYRYVPAHAREIVEEREREQGRRGPLRHGDA